MLWGCFNEEKGTSDLYFLDKTVTTYIYLYVNSLKDHMLPFYGDQEEKRRSGWMSTKFR